VARALRDYIQGNLGATYRTITTDGGYNGTDKADVFGIALDRTMAYLFLPDVAETDLPDDFVRGYVGDAATRTAMPFCIDYYSTNTGLSDTLQPAPVGNPIIRAATRQQYNRVDQLQKIDALLAARMTLTKQAFIAHAGDIVQLAGSSIGIHVSSYGDGMLTADPDSFALVDPGRIFSPGFGIVGIRSDPIVVSRPVVLVEGPGGPLFP
jgi:hypothetical protein